MTSKSVAVNVKKMTEEAREKLFLAREKAVARKKANIEFTAGVLVAELGRDDANRFLKKIEGLEQGQAYFSGAEPGFEKVRSNVALEVECGYAIDPINGANYALRGVDADGNRMVIALDFDAAVAVTRSLHQHLVMMDDTNLCKGSGMRGQYKDLLDWLAEHHLDLDPAKGEIYRDAKRQAELTIRAHARSAEEKAMEVAERKVEGMVRKLSQAAAMPPGIERAMLLEETSEMVRKAFGGVNK